MRLTFALAAAVVALNAYAIAASTQPATRPDDDAAWQALSDGRQSDAERVIRQRLKDNPQDARTQFVAGLLVRSRFDKQGAAPYLDQAIKLAPNTDEAAAATAVRALDNGGFFYKADPDFEILRKLADRHAEDGAYLWLLAIECRTYNENEGGVAAYEKLGTHFKTGPVLFHQTYANLLDNLQKYDRSLPHRLEAVRLEPEPWSYSALGDTYWRMGQPKDAIGPYQKALKFQPNDVEILRRLLINAIDAKDGAVAVDAGQRVVALRPQSFVAHELLSKAYSVQGDQQKLADELKLLCQMRPGDQERARTTAELLHSLNRHEEAPQIDPTFGK
ncbi:MAG: hypothetical protein JWM57_1963 [Phycisphaerales bacterium]|nr:hypothetical protein [Phycisphaerales bacterium]